MISRRQLYPFLTVFAMLFAACNDDLDRKTTLTFTGDSIIARWDLQNYFSSLATTNLGVSGAGIDYIESLSGRMKGLNVVIMIGTNDNYMFHDEGPRKEYEVRYMAALDALEAETIYLYEVLPREFNNQDAVLNDYIRLFNNEIAEFVAERPSIVYLQVFDSFIDTGNHINQQYYNDGLHLSPEGYEILADALFNEL